MYCHDPAHFPHLPWPSHTFQLFHVIVPPLPTHQKRFHHWITFSGFHMHWIPFCFIVSCLPFSFEHCPFSFILACLFFISPVSSLFVFQPKRLILIFLNTQPVNLRSL